MIFYALLVTPLALKCIEIVRRNSALISLVRK